MKIKTTRFGEIEKDENVTYKFIIPILGFNEEDEFMLVEANANSSFKWLQSTKTPELAFAVTAPAFFDIEYSFELPDEVETTLEIKSAEELLVLNMAKIPNNNPRQTTLNLLAPIVFNTTNHHAGQVILNKTGFSVTHPLFDDEKRKEE